MHGILTAIVFVLILAALVLVHEFGHFIIAKKSGMQVEEFGFGFPPRIWSVKKGETRYSLNLIPLGGFVKMVGENNEGEDNPRSFINKSFWARFGTLIAGVVMNFILAWVLFIVGFSVGLPTALEQGQTLPPHATLHSEAITVIQTGQDSPAQKAGIREGDQIVAVDDVQAQSIDQVIATVKDKSGKQIDLHLKRGNESLDVKVTPRVNPPADQGALGIELSEVGKVSFPVYIAPAVALRATWQVMQNTATGFYHLIFQGQGVKQLGGPVKIAQLTGQVTTLGFAYILQFAAVLSVNLGILNVVPFPALDGGRILFLIIEKVRGKRNNALIERWFNTVGFILLMGLILLITIKDVRGLF